MKKLLLLGHYSGQPAGKGGEGKDQGENGKEFLPFYTEPCYCWCHYSGILAARIGDKGNQVKSVGI